MAMPRGVFGPRTEGSEMKTLLAALFGITILAPCVWAQAEPSQKKPTPKTPTAVPKRSLLNPATLKAQAPDVYKVRFTTSKGIFVAQVTRAWAPLGADRFYNLVKNGFYDGAGFFRIVPNFVVQFGISANPAVSKAWKTAKISDDPVTQSNRRGYLTFATSGPNTRTTQLFINLADNARLDSMGFSPFGQVTEGMEVVDKLNAEYGEQPDQSRIEAEGKTYLEKNFTRLDIIKTATVLTAPAAHKPAAHPTATTKKTAP
jgi:peptidyl-prolyl cis-trans isomerase A (cyclophilin A)